MARLHFVKKARKDVPNSDIKAGESYYWWQFRFQKKRCSKTRPRRAQLTQSEFNGTIFDLEDDIAEAVADSSLADIVQQTIDRLRELADECEEKRSNMPDALQDSDSGNLLQERADACQSAADDFESIDLDDFEADEDATKLARADDSDIEEVNADGLTEVEYWQEKLDEVQNVSIDLP
jgi:hypothetical protein